MSTGQQRPRAHRLTLALRCRIVRDFMAGMDFVPLGRKYHMTAYGVGNRSIEQVLRSALGKPRAKKAKR